MTQGELFEYLRKGCKAGETKVCKQCNLEKNVDSFRLYRRATGDRDSRDSKCKKCQRYNQDVTERIRATAPPAPSSCDCCGGTFDKLVLDHCHKEEVFRGWLCDRCNRGIGVLGDTVDSLNQALEYLRKTDERP